MFSTECFRLINLINEMLSRIDLQSALFCLPSTVLPIQLMNLAIVLNE